MEGGPIRAALARLIEAEIERGIPVWAEPEWNEAARSFVSRGTGQTGERPERPASSPTAQAPRQAGSPAPQAPRPAGSPASQAPRPAPPPESYQQRPGALTPPPATRRPAASPPRPQFGPPPEAADRDANWREQLDALRREAGGCARCGLHETRTNVVVDSGEGRVPLLFIGEAPGADEDAQGEAFVGRAGQLLTRIIAAIGLDRHDVYICNVLKCRPPGNRNPNPDEVAACRSFLERQVEILKPRVICALGLIATQMLLESRAPMGSLRGRLFRYRGIPLLPTYHPAALLRNPNLKRTVWEDMLVLRRILDEGISPKTTIEVAPERAPRPPESGELFS